VSCPICEKRKAARFCPAKGEKICAVCCGIEREVTIDCPSDCSYLVAAHRYENDHQHHIPADTPLLDEKNSAGHRLHAPAADDRPGLLHCQILRRPACRRGCRCTHCHPGSRRNLQNAELRYHLRKTAGRSAPARTLRCSDCPSHRNQKNSRPSAPRLRTSKIRTFSIYWFFSTGWDCCAPTAARVRAASSNSSAANSPPLPI